MEAGKPCCPCWSVLQNRLARFKLGLQVEVAVADFKLMVSAEGDGKERHPEQDSDGVRKRFSMEIANDSGQRVDCHQLLIDRSKAARRS